MHHVEYTESCTFSINHLSPVVDCEACAEEREHVAVDRQHTDRREEAERREHRQLRAVPDSERDDVGERGDGDGAAGMPCETHQFQYKIPRF